MSLPRRLPPAVLAVLLASGCSAVKMSRVRPDYEQVDQRATKRLVVVTSPAPAGSEPVGMLWSTFARQHVNQNRDFIAKESRVAPSGDFSPKDACGEGLEGVLLLRPREVRRTGRGVDAGVFAQLVRCSDQQEVWAAEGGGSWDSENPNYDARRDQYVEQFGEEVRPYAVPSMRLLEAVLDTLPNPVLDENDVTEKIELGE